MMTMLCSRAELREVREERADVVVGVARLLIVGEAGLARAGRLAPGTSRKSARYSVGGA
jgi:hypothetical protein